MIAIVVITFNRVHLLSECVERVLRRTSELTTEIVIWDNGSTDQTQTYLSSINDPRFTVVRSETNVGMNGYARGFAQTSAPLMVELDDDVTDAPPEWDRTLLDAYRRVPDIGFLAADLVDDPYDGAAHVRYRVRPDDYVEETVEGVRLLRGPTGGGCAMTDRALSDSVGGFRERPNETFWLEDEAYIKSIVKIGRTAAVLADLKVRHKGGPHYSAQSLEKQRYWENYERTLERKWAVKRALLGVPFARAVNARLGIFEEPPPATK